MHRVGVCRVCRVGVHRVRVHRVHTVGVCRDGVHRVRRVGVHRVGRVGAENPQKYPRSRCCPAHEPACETLSLFDIFLQLMSTNWPVTGRTANSGLFVPGKVGPSNVVKNTSPFDPSSASVASTVNATSSVIKNVHFRFRFIFRIQNVKWIKILLLQLFDFMVNFGGLQKLREKKQCSWCLSPLNKTNKNLW